MCVCVRACVRACVRVVCVCVCVLGLGWVVGAVFDDKFVYINIVCFDVGCF